MKFVMLGAAALAASALVSPLKAQAVISDPGYCAQFYPNANCQNLGLGNPYADGRYYHNDPTVTQAADNAYRYHGGPKSND